MYQTGGSNVKWGNRCQMGEPGTTAPPADDGPARTTRLQTHS